MPTRSENIETRLDAIATELAAMSPTTAGGKPNATGGDTVAHVGYRMSLIAEQKELRLALVAADGAYEITSEMNA